MAAVYIIQPVLIVPENRKRGPAIKNIYQSDGAKKYFKNKYQIANLIFHEKDFSILKFQLHWTENDGLGAIFKRLANKE